MARGDRYRGGLESCDGQHGQRVMRGEYVQCSVHGVYAVSLDDMEPEELAMPPVLALGHQCDAWVIGTVEDAERLIADLTAAIAKLKTP